VIVTSAVIPERALGGTESSVTVTGYDTTELLPLLLVLAMGEIAETLPVTSAAMAESVIAAGWPTARSPIPIS
jgi:hypothetical protein